MKRWLSALSLVLLLARGPAHAQVPGFGSMPVDIVNADQTYFENGVAYADGNVIIQYAETSIYADHAQYHPDTHDVLVLGHVRIYRDGQNFVGERAVYNFETKKLHAANFQGDFYPFRFSTESMSTIGSGAYLVRDVGLTTSDSSLPDYTLRAKSARIYPGQRIIMRNVTLFVHNVPVFWWPYLYQPLRRDMFYAIRPGYYSDWGYFTLSQWNFPIADNWQGKFLADYREQRGLAVGLETAFRFGPNDESWGSFRSYYAKDSAPPTISVGGQKQHVTSDRYRISLQDRVYLTDDLWANINFTKLSDVRMLRDFLPREYRLDPQPDNVASLTQWDPNYTVSLVTRVQANKFYDTTERLPELALDVTRHPVRDGWNLFYSGETSVAHLRYGYSTAALNPGQSKINISPGVTDITTLGPALLRDYGYNRFDTYHEFHYPMEFFNFLSFIPRLGLRGDYYSKTGSYGVSSQNVTVSDLLPNNSINLYNLRVVNTGTVPLSGHGTLTQNELSTHGALFRGVVDGGFESSFKLTREYPHAESRALGLDDLRHVIQPYMDFSFAATTASPKRVLQIDRFQPSTQLPSFDFPQFNAIDTISNWAIVQVGLRNRLETKRDNTTFEWLSLDTFADINLKQPSFATGNFRQGPVSNLYNQLSFSPVPWAALRVDAQTPLNSHGYNMIDTSLNYMATKDLQLSLSHQYLDHNPFFQNSSLVSTKVYYRIDDNWAVSARESYEFADSTLQTQQYELSRDLSSWVASLGVRIEDNGAGSSPRTLYALLFTLSLKDIPQAAFPFQFDPGNLGGKGD